MVDWGLAGQVARFAAGSDQPPPSAALEADLAERAARFEPAVAGYSGLTLADPSPAPEALSRAAWAAMNLEALSRLLDPVAGRLDRRFDSAGPLAGALRIGASATLAAEAGLVMGYVSQRVLGQYELSLLQPEASPRLVFVAPNLEGAVAELGVERDSFLSWIVVHELTHVFQFQGVPWLRDHMTGLIQRYLESVEVRIERGAAGGLPSLPSPARLAELFREGGLVALVQTRAQRRLMAEMQALMAVIEGYSEHVMDAVGERELSGYAGLRDAMEARRSSRSAPEKALQRLLGLEAKLRQYEEGKRFCDAVVERGGTEGLNRVWEGPESLPTVRELSHPDEWLRRTSGPSSAAA